MIKALKGAKGPRGQSVTGLTGPQGPKGDTGAAGATGAQGPSGVVTTGAFSGDGNTSIPGSSSAWIFVDHTATVTTTASQRLTGAAEVPLYSTASTSGQYFDYGLCYQPSTGGTVTNFTPYTYSSSHVYPDAADVRGGSICRARCGNLERRVLRL